MSMENKIPAYYKTLPIYNWDGVFYYKNHPCDVVTEIIEGKEIDECGDRAGRFSVLDSGFIRAKTITGDYLLKIRYDIEV
jgi:hypothetical protein